MKKCITLFALLQCITTIIQAGQNMDIEECQDTLLHVTTRSSSNSLYEHSDSSEDGGADGTKTVILGSAVSPRGSVFPNNPPYKTISNKPPPPSPLRRHSFADLDTASTTQLLQQVLWAMYRVRDGQKRLEERLDTLEDLVLQNSPQNNDNPNPQS